MREATDALQRCRAISPRRRALQAHYSPSGGGEGGWVGAKITEIRLRRCSAQVKHQLLNSKLIMRYLVDFYAYLGFCSLSQRGRLHLVTLYGKRRTLRTYSKRDPPSNKNWIDVVCFVCVYTWTIIKITPRGFRISLPFWCWPMNVLWWGYI